MPASKKLVAIGATADIRTRHALARNDAIDPNATFSELLVDHLVGDGEHRWGHLDAERSRSLKVYGELEFG